MDFDFILPLEQQALVIIANTLWNPQCMDALVMNYNKEMYTVGNDPVSERVVNYMMCNELIGKISNLSLPETIKYKLMWIARNVGLQKLNYYFHHACSWDIRKLPKTYHWTSRGSINKKKTTRSLVNDDTIDISKRYSLACFYCFEEEIQELGRKLSISDEVCLNKLSSFWYEITLKKRNKQKHRQSIETENEDLWIVNNVIKTYKQAYKHSLRIVNSVAAEYFLSKLTTTEYSLQEREQDRRKFLKAMLVKYYGRWSVFWPKEHILDVALFLLKQMTKDQQMEALTVDPHLTFLLFLDWPLHCMFFEAVEILCPYASTKNLSDILCCIRRKMSNSCKGFDYREVFTKFWRALPESQKADVINHCLSSSSSLIHNLLEVGYFEGIMLIDRGVTATQKQDFIHSFNGLLICQAFISTQEWRLLKLFIDICLPSTVLNLEFKKRIKRFIAEKRYIAENRINYVSKTLGIPEDVGN